MASTVRAAPARAPSVTRVDVASNSTISATAAAAAPALMPTMSGLASGLRATRWKMAPDRPQAAVATTSVTPSARRSGRGRERAATERRGSELHQLAAADQRDEERGADEG